MKVTIDPKHTGKNTYTDLYRCPIAMGLIDAGCERVFVGTTIWQAVKPVRFLGRVLFRKDVAGFVPTESNRKAEEISRARQDKLVTVKLLRGSGRYFDHPNFKT